MSPKRIIIYFPSWGLGGSTIYLGQYVKSLVKSGFKVICVFRKRDTGSDYLIKLGAEIIYSRFPLSLGITSAPKHNNISMYGIIKNLLKFIYGVFFSTYLLISYRPYIVLIGEYTLLQCSISAIIFNYKTIYFIQSDISTNKNKRKIVEYFLNKADHIIAITKIHLQLLNITKTSNQVIHNIVTVKTKTKNNILKDLNITSNEKIITLIGGINEHKGTELFVQIASVLIKKRTDIMFLLIGPVNKGHYTTYILKLIKDYELTNSIKIIGEVDNIQDYLSITNILISCNTHAHFMRPVIEAWAQKIPVVVADDIYGHYLVDNKKDGCIAKHKVKSWVDNIEWLLDDSNRRITLGEEGYKKYRNYFSDWNFEDNYEKLINMFL